MATKVTTLKNADKTDDLVPRTQLKGIFDKNGNYIDNDLLASDLNKLKGGVVDELVICTEDEVGVPIPLNADLLNGHADNYFMGIEESGTGYIRFANGLQICWGNVSYTIVSWVAWGALYQAQSSSGHGVSIPFPKSFIATPSVSLQSFFPSGTGSLGQSVADINANGINDVCLLRPNNGGGTNVECIVSYIAIGTWK